MKRKTIGFTSLAILLAVGFALAGCGDDNGGGAQFRAYIEHFGGDDLVGGMEVRAIDNNTGLELGINETSDASGWVAFDELPAGDVGFLCVGVPGDWVDTYQFNIDSSAQEERLWAVDHTTYVGVPAMAGIVLEDGKAIVAGAVYWVNAADEEEPVGCVTVDSVPTTPDVRYMGENGMPTLITEQAETHHLWGRFVVANLEPGSASTTAYDGTTALGSTSLFTYADSIAISNIYHEGTSNPTPAGCQ
jgi:hypothetical protein